MTDAPTLERRVAEAMVRELGAMARDGRLGGALYHAGQVWDGKRGDWIRPYAPVFAINGRLDLLPLARAALAAAGVEGMREALAEAREYVDREVIEEDPNDPDKRVRDRIDAALAAGQEDKPHE